MNQSSQENDDSASQKRAEIIESVLKTLKTGSMIARKLYIKRPGGMSFSLRERYQIKVLGISVSLKR